jgi:hypothetical protein
MSPNAGVTVVARPVKHRVAVTYTAREQNAVAIERQIRVVQLMEGLEIIGVGEPDSWTVVAVAPRDVVAIL